MQQSTENEAEFANFKVDSGEVERGQKIVFSGRLKRAGAPVSEVFAIEFKADGAAGGYGYQSSGDGVFTESVLALQSGLWRARTRDEEASSAPLRVEVGPAEGPLLPGGGTIALVRTDFSAPEGWASPARELKREW